MASLTLCRVPTLNPAPKMEVVAHHGPLYCPSLPFLDIPKAPSWPSNTPLQPSSCSPLPQIRSLLHFLRSLSAPFSLRSMASLTGSAVFTSACPCPCASRQSQVVKGFSGLKTVSFNNQRRNFPSLRSQRFRVSCAAKVETVQKVCEIVRKQLALADDTPVTGESKFSDFGADSLDTVEIVMGLEEAFEITVEEDNAQSIATVQDAADLIEKLVEAK